MEIFEDEKEVLMEGEFDGIRELNNGLPPWLMWLFYLTIFWGAVYMVHYHTYKQGDLQETEYAKEVAAANKNKGKIEELKEIKLFTDAANIGEGSKLFVQRNCITCHGNNGEGNTVGPNLTDEYWINGGTPMQIFTMIKNGNIAKGMMPFKDQLTDKQTIQLASFILNKLQGSNPANAKAPQGEKIAKK